MRININELEALESFYEKNYLNVDGLRRYCKYLRNEVVNHSPRIKEVCSKKGLHNEK